MRSAGRFASDSSLGGIQRDFAAMTEQLLKLGMWFSLFAGVYWGRDLSVRDPVYEERILEKTDDCGFVYTWYKQSGRTPDDKDPQRE